MAAIQLLIVLILKSLRSSVAETPALFVFGDSLVDAGNNNYLNTRSRANFPPFGMNFYEHIPTGRFTDGRLVPDYIASYLNLTLPPPYLGAGDNILLGANFGSGGSGIHNTTGSGGASFSRQVQYFREAKQRLDALLGAHNSSRLVSKSIFYVTIGNNDFANNYYINRGLQRNYTLSQYEDLLISVVRHQIQELYGLAARKFVITSVATLGCNPASLYLYGIDEPGQCATTYDSAARSYNKKLQSLLTDLRSTLTNSHIVYANLYGVMMSVIRNGTSYGFSNVNEPCCPFGGYFECFMFAPTCQEPSEHVFWDLFHPTGKFNQYIARRFWRGDSSDVSPMNIHTLAKT